MASVVIIPPSRQGMVLGNMNLGGKLGVSAAFLAFITYVYLMSSFHEHMMFFKAVEHSSKASTVSFGTLEYLLPFPVYFINMDTSVARQTRMENIFRPLLGNLRRVSGVDGRNVTAVTELLGALEYAAKVKNGVTEDGRDSTINYGELGCILSHLLAIRQAYVDGNEMALILEDDVTPLLMPFWTLSLPQLCQEAYRMSPSWAVIQIGWTWGQDRSIYNNDTPNTVHHLRSTKFQWGTFAYVISREGMKFVIDTFFDNGVQSTIRLLDGPSVAEDYFDTLPNVLVAVPALFTVEGADSIISEDSSRLELHRKSTIIHSQATLEVYYNRLSQQSR